MMVAVLCEAGAAFHNLHDKIGRVAAPLERRSLFAWQIGGVAAGGLGGSSHGNGNPSQEPGDGSFSSSVSIFC